MMTLFHGPDILCTGHVWLSSWRLFGFEMYLNLVKLV